jgi:hypothetical protein
MENLKLFGLLRAMKREETAAFYKQLSRLHKAEELPVKVFGYIRKFHPLYRDTKKLEIAFAYKKIFEESIDAQENNRNKLLNILSDLNLALKEFLIQKTLSKNTLEAQYLWASVLLERGLESDFEKTAGEMRDGIKKTAQDSTIALLNHLLADYLYYYHPSLNVAQSNFEILHQCNQSLDLFYTLLKHKLACELANINNVFPGKEGAQVQNNVPSEIDPKMHLLINLYSEAYLLLTSPKEGNKYEQVESLLFENADIINGDELYVIFSYLHNYASIKIRKGRLEFWEKVHQLNKFGVKYRVFTNSGLISGTQFNNIVGAACMAKDLEWADTFIKTTAGFLPNDIRDEVLLLSEAIVAFERKDFQLTLDKLMYVDFIDPPYAVRAKSLIIMSHYELHQPQQFILSLCDALAGYLRRNRGGHKKVMDATLNFMTIVKRLTKGTEDAKQIYLDIQKAPDLSFRAWLLEKAAAARDAGDSGGSNGFG